MLGGLTTDQRGAGFPRVNGPAVDMGAFESGAATLLGCTLDLDGNGSINATTDGLMLARSAWPDRNDSHRQCTRRISHSRRLGIYSQLSQRQLRNQFRAVICLLQAPGFGGARSQRPPSKNGGASCMFRRRWLCRPARSLSRLKHRSENSTAPGADIDCFAAATSRYCPKNKRNLHWAGAFATDAFQIRQTPSLVKFLIRLSIAKKIRCTSRNSTVSHA